MGMYTELVFAYEIPNDELCEDEKDILSHLFVGTDIKYANNQKHPFFRCNRWMLVGKCDSYYFNGDTTSSMRYDAISKRQVITTRFNIKNYDGEIEMFLSWIHQRFAPKHGKEFVGYKRYEEDDYPTLIFFDNKNVVFEPTQPMEDS